jgi:hypothetical protein
MKVLQVVGIFVLVLLSTAQRRTIPSLWNVCGIVGAKEKPRPDSTGALPTKLRQRRLTAVIFHLRTLVSFKG